MNLHIISNTIVRSARKHVKKQCHCFYGGTAGETAAAGGGCLQVGGGGGGGGSARCWKCRRQWLTVAGEKRTKLNASPPPSPSFAPPRMGTPCGSQAADDGCVPLALVNFSISQSASSPESGRTGGISGSETSTPLLARRGRG